MRRGILIVVVILSSVTVWGGGDYEETETGVFVTVVDGTEELTTLEINQQEGELPFTINVHAYLYWPDYRSYTALQYVRVLVVPLDSSVDPYYVEDSTNEDGKIQLTMNLHEPVSLIFEFDKELEMGSVIARDHLLPMTTFIAGSPNQDAHIHVALMTIRHLLFHYGVDVFRRLYYELSLSLAGVPDIQAKVLAGPKEDLWELCYGESREYVQEKLGEDIKNGICSWAAPDSADG